MITGGRKASIVRVATRQAVVARIVVDHPAEVAFDHAIYEGERPGRVLVDAGAVRSQAVQTAATIQEVEQLHIRARLLAIPNLVELHPS
eukprot:scaffold22833_cov76-Phaeocystis_antarctica.AAC.4